MDIPSKTVRDVMRDLEHREQLGIIKYGTTVDRTDFLFADWLQHAYEEALDLSNYLKRGLNDLKGGYLLIAGGAIRTSMDAETLRTQLMQAFRADGAFLSIVANAVENAKAEQSLRDDLVESAKAKPESNAKDLPEDFVNFLGMGWIGRPDDIKRIFGEPPTTQE